MQIRSYTLHFILDPQKGSFRGDTLIQIDGMDDGCVLDAVGLKIENVEVDDKIAQFRYDESKGKLSINTSGSRIHILYEGSIDSGMVGMYAAGYKEVKMLSTQLEAVGARRLFPCIDNPEHKATFNVSVSVPKRYDVISNTDPIRIEEQLTSKIVVFDETPIMSTYLLYIGVAEFQDIEDHAGKTIVRVKTTKNANIEHAEQTLSYGIEFLQWLESYFGMPYVLAKLDLIAVPQFSSGAMENWGAITFREMYVIADKSSSTIVKRRIAEVTAHEIVHQWFGNLVTMKWWDDLWLNESFATFMAYKAVDAIYPDWNYWDDFLMQETGSALQEDSLQETHPVEAHVKDPNEIEQIFDHISYGKGGSILRMIEHYIGFNAFQDGLHSYLTKYAYKNAEGEDLWKALEESSGKNISAIMRTWVKQEGHPFVEAKLINGQLFLQQKRFSLAGQASDILWPIPLVYCLDGKEYRQLFDQKQLTIEVKNSKRIEINSDRSGFYEVLYDEQLLVTLLENIQELNSYAVWGLLFDYSLFLEAGMICLDTYLDIIQAAKSCSDAMIVRFIASSLKGLYTILGENVKLQNIALPYFQYQIERIGMKANENEDSVLSLIRGSILEGLVLMDPSFSTTLLKIYSDYDQTPADIRTAVSLALVAQAKENAFETMLTLFHGASIDEDKIRIIRSVFSSNFPTVQKKGLDFVLGGEVKKQDIPLLLIRASAFKSSHKMLREWMQSSFVSFAKNYDAGATRWPAEMIEAMTPYIGMEESDKIFSIYSEPFFADMKYAIEKGKEMLDINLKLLHAAE